MSPKEALRYVTCIDLVQSQFSRERQLHTDGVGRPDALPFESGMATGLEISKQRFITLGRAMGRSVLFCGAALAAAEAYQGVAFVVSHI